MSSGHCTHLGTIKHSPTKTQQINHGAMLAPHPSSVSLTPCSLAAVTTLRRMSSSTKGLTASWMITTSGWSSARAFRPLKIDLWRVAPASASEMRLCPNLWMMLLIASMFSIVTDTTMSFIQHTLQGKHCVHLIEVDSKVH